MKSEVRSRKSEVGDKETRETRAGLFHSHKTKSLDYLYITPVVIRVPNNILAQVDQPVSQRPFKAPRRTWLMEAILEKLQQEGQSTL